MTQKLLLFVLQYKLQNVSIRIALEANIFVNISRSRSEIFGQVLTSDIDYGQTGLDFACRTRLCVRTRLKNIRICLLELNILLEVELFMFVRPR